jgi:nitronate monooxygenase
MQTAFTRLVGCTHPLQQAPMGGVSGPELAGAVASAGALGMLCVLDLEPPEERMTDAIARAGGGAVGMGFFGHRIQEDLATFEAAAARLRVVEVFWTTPDAALVARARSAGEALVAWQVGSLDDALAAQDAGCDFVVTQGVEAGGHVRGTQPLDALLRAACERVSIPIVAAGGIATAESVAAALSAGASAARIGTAFVATYESRGHAGYIDALLAAQGGDDTVLTTAFARGWPDAPHRVLKSALAAAEAFEGDVVAEGGPPGARRPVPRFSSTTPSRHVVGRIDAMAQYAGMGVGSVTSVLPAADLVAELVSRIV